MLELVRPESFVPVHGTLHHLQPPRRARARDRRAPDHGRPERRRARARAELPAGGRPRATRAASTSRAATTSTTTCSPTAPSSPSWGRSPSRSWSTRRGHMLAPPDLTARGVVLGAQIQDVLAQARIAAKRAFRHAIDDGLGHDLEALREAVRRKMTRFFFDSLGQRVVCLVLVHVVRDLMLRRCAAALWLSAVVASCTAPAPLRESARSSASPRERSATRPGAGPLAACQRGRAARSFRRADARDRAAARPALSRPRRRAHRGSCRHARLRRPRDRRRAARARASAAIWRSARSTPTLDVRALLGRVMEEELVGYYDPKQKRLAVRSDVARELGMASPSPGRAAARLGRAQPHLARHGRARAGARAAGSALRARPDHRTDAHHRRRQRLRRAGRGRRHAGDARLHRALSGESLGRAGAASRARAQRDARARPISSRGRCAAHPLCCASRCSFATARARTSAPSSSARGGWARVDDAHREAPRPARCPCAIRAATSTDTPRADAGTAARPLAARARLRAVDDDVLGGLELSVVLGISGVEAEYIVSAGAAIATWCSSTTTSCASLWWLRFASAASARNAAARVRAARAIHCAGCTQRASLAVGRARTRRSDLCTRGGHARPGQQWTRRAHTCIARARSSTQRARASRHSRRSACHQHAPALDKRLSST